jgi:hypothetical protein
LVLEGIIQLVVSVYITRSIPLLLVDYWSSRNTDYWVDDALEDQYSTNRRGIDLLIETLTAGRMISSRTNSPPTEEVFVEYYLSRVSSTQ